MVAVAAVARVWTPNKYFRAFKSGKEGGTEIVKKEMTNDNKL